LDPLAIIKTVGGFAPVLTHIYVPFEPDNIWPMIQNMVTGMDRRGLNDSRDDEGIYLQNLETLFVEGCRIVWEDRKWYLDLLTDNPHVACRERTWQGELEAADRMYNHWLARLDGEDGYWSLDGTIGSAQDPHIN
jgi:hypothetical protein